MVTGRNESKKKIAFSIGLEIHYTCFRLETEKRNGTSGMMGLTTRKDNIDKKEENLLTQEKIQYRM